MPTPRDLASALTQAGVSVMTVLPPKKGREGWKINLCRASGGWCCGPEAETLDEAFAEALKAFTPWSERGADTDGDLDDCLEDLLG